jgi:hypothetical protein
MKIPIWAVLVVGILLIDAVLVAIDGGWREAARTALLVVLFVLLYRRPAAPK